mgnify:CR=1 FL=1
MYFNENGQTLPNSLDWANSFGYRVKNLENSNFFPSTIHANSILTSYEYRYLLQRAISVFEWTLPESIERNYFLYTMYNIGYGFVFNTEKYGTIFNHGGLYGYDVYYQPRYAVVANPLLTEEYGENPDKYGKMIIGDECAVIRLTPDYLGIADICKYYAELLSVASSSLVTNLYNTKLAYVFGATNKNMAESFKKMYDKIASGEPAVFIDKKLYDENGNLSLSMFNSAVKTVYIGDQLLEDIRSILNDFDSCVGIPNSNLNKKERMITDEANMNNFETKSLCYLWMDTLKKDLKKSNELFPNFKIDVKFRKEVEVIAERSNDYSANAV